jgi:hypothetical protein
MNELDRTVLELQNSILFGVHGDMQNHSAVSLGIVMGYCRAIDIINQNFRTNYKSEDLKRLAIESDKPVQLVSPLFG